MNSSSISCWNPWSFREVSSPDPLLLCSLPLSQCFCHGEPLQGMGHQSSISTIWTYGCYKVGGGGSVLECSHDDAKATSLSLTVLNPLRFLLTWTCSEKIVVWLQNNYPESIMFSRGFMSCYIPGSCRCTWSQCLVFANSMTVIDRSLNLVG